MLFDIGGETEPANKEPGKTAPKRKRWGIVVVQLTFMDNIQHEIEGW